MYYSDVNDCQRCMDSGFIFVKLKESEPVVFMFCDCKKGSGNYTFYNGCIPMWSKNMNAIGFNVQEFDLKLFLPEKEDLLNLTTVENVLNLNSFTRFRDLFEKSKLYFSTLASRQESGDLVL